MGTKLNKMILLLFMLIVIINSTISKNDYYLKDICINKICLKSSFGDYRLYFEGKTIKDSIVWDDYEEEKKRQVIYESDSLYIFMSSYDTTRLYSKYIEIWSSKYAVYLKDMKFKVGMDIHALSIIMPDIKEKYESYVGKYKKHFARPAYFGIPLILETNNNKMPFYPCQGLKFQIKEGIIISILIDFRTDGDF